MLREAIFIVAGKTAKRHSLAGKSAPQLMVRAFGAQSDAEEGGRSLRAWFLQSVVANQR